MNFQDCQHYLENIQRLGVKFGLENVSTVLKSLDNPHSNYPTVLVAGSNGKGSVCSMLTRILSLGGYRVGLFTSPHLVTVRERFRIGSRLISEKSFSGLLTLLRGRIDALLEEKELITSPTYFEILTCLAFLYFSGKNVDMAVLEVGMGGRYDATNVSNPIVSVITTISKEHQKFLGETLGQIAGEKAGIMRAEVPVVCGVEEPEALAVLEKRAGELHAPFHRVFCPQTEFVHEKRGDTSVYRIRAEGGEYLFRPALSGGHQGKNAAVAVYAADLLNRIWRRLEKNQIIRGVETTRWEGRMERVSECPLVFLDGAHNEEGARALKAFILEKTLLPVILVFASMRDKKIEQIADILFPLAEKIFLTRFSYHRAANPEDIFEVLTAYQKKIDVEPDLQKAFRKALDAAGQDKTVIVAGSLFLVGGIKELLSKGWQGDKRKRCL
jgi:dihydrofolate synthase/folylpolyglutamate synthase